MKEIKKDLIKLRLIDWGTGATNAVKANLCRTMKMLKKSIYSNWKYKLGAALQKKMFSELKEFMNYQNYGGSVILGARKTVVKGHGSSSARAIEVCIEQVCHAENAKMNEKISEALNTST